jgi:hypothetical protein
LWVTLWVTNEGKIRSNLPLSAQYDPSGEILELGFTKGHTYAYKGVPRRVYDEFLKTDSKGRYAQKKNLDKYPCSKLR